MQEFESISASSYDPSALATKLTAKAADGWSVVAIVPTGGDVTAFLSRGNSGSDAAMPDTAQPANEGSTAEGAAPIIVPAENMADTNDSLDTAEPVAEPAGWAIAPEAAAATAAATSPTLAGSGSTATSQSGMDNAGAAPVAAAAAAPAAAAPPEPAPAPSVPAGWYADPAGRFELRYWDGTTWTEHVSRAGQQFTDPPVA